MAYCQDQKGAKEEDAIEHECKQVSESDKSAPEELAVSLMSKHVGQVRC